MVLKAGRRVGASGMLKAGAAGKAPTIISIKLLSREAERKISPAKEAGARPHARLAISVPKRLLKSAVDRNRFKRWVREAFRCHEIRALPVDLLISLTEKIRVERGASGGQTHEAIKYALCQAKKLALLPKGVLR